MAPEVVTDRGEPLTLGRELGRGGEGAVFEVSERPDCAAKVYHRAPGLDRQDKLQAMADSVNDELLSYAAWPLETLIARADGRMLGFLTRRVVGALPVHALYGPSQRKRDLPGARFDFLVHSARNTAAAFASLHAHGHVAGDVNQGNVLIREDSHALLIDCDSFQVTGRNGRVHRCEVGVAHFTPPELQSVATFGATPRTANHDNFGLALLIFHLLFAGRHPFSGVTASRDEIPLERAIARFGFAYGRNAASLGIRQPPNSLDLSLVPRPLGAMFELAFAETGPSDRGRPTASQWVDELDALRYSLTTCDDQPAHVYPQHLRACPWCRMDARGVVLFAAAAHSRPPAAEPGFDLDQVWSAIASVRMPPAGPPPELVRRRPTAAAIGIGCFNRLRRRARLIGAGTCLIGLASVATLPPNLGFSVTSLALLSLGVLPMLARKPIADAPARFREAAAAATKARNRLAEQWGHEPATRAFDAKHRLLSEARSAYWGLMHERAMRQQASRTAPRADLAEELKGVPIDEAMISGIDPIHKFLLAKSGVTSAGDIDFATVKSILGQTTLADAMVGWRAAAQARLLARRSALPIVIDAQASTFDARLGALEHQLKQGSAQLSQIVESVISQRAALQDKLAAASADLAQAQANLRAARGDVA